MMHKQTHTAIIAHRGASALAKHENTLESFQIAIDLKVDMVEFDVRQTKDGQLIIYHDRDFHGNEIGTLTYHQMNQQAHNEDYHIPLLEEVLNLCQGKVKLDIELKEAGFEEHVMDLVKEKYDYDEFSIKSFVDEVPLVVKELDPKITTGLLLGHEVASVATRLSEYYPEKRMHRCKADFVSPYFRFVTKDFKRRMAIRRWPIYVWTVNKEEAIEKYYQMGVAGIITDRPDIGMQIKEK